MQILVYKSLEKEKTILDQQCTDFPIGVTDLG